jgi:hypothetical protein
MLGTVQLFDTFKGFGFIAPEGGGMTFRAQAGTMARSCGADTVRGADRASRLRRSRDGQRL